MGNINLTGFHGTLKENITAIEEDGFTSQYRDNHWLGQGIYFYEDYDLAHWFISRNMKTDKTKRGKGQSIAIIEALFTSSKVKVLDLDNYRDINRFYEEIHKIWEELRTLTFTENEYKNRCLILDVLSEYLDLDIVIMTFEREDPPPSYGVASTGWFNHRLFPINIKYKEKQICVKNPCCIEIKKVDYPKHEYNIPRRIKFNM